MNYDKQQELNRQRREEVRRLYNNGRGLSVIKIAEKLRVSRQRVYQLIATK